MEGEGAAENGEISEIDRLLMTLNSGSSSGQDEGEVHFENLSADELNANPAVHEFLSFVSDRLTAGRITLLYSAKDTEHNNAVVLAGWLNRNL